MSNDEKLNYILDELKAINDRLNDMTATGIRQEGVLIRQQGILDHHVYRTDLAEKNIAQAREVIEQVKTKAEEDLSQINAKIEPLKKHVAMFEGALKFLGVVALVVTIVAGLISFFK